MDQILLSKARTKLLLTWIFGSIVPLLTIVLQTILNSKYEGMETQIWGWFSPLIFPTMTLMIGIVGATAISSGRSNSKTVSKSFLNICIGLSIFYLLLIVIVIFTEPFSRISNPIKNFTISNLFLTPIQAITTAAIGYLFSSAKENRNQNK